MSAREFTKEELEELKDDANRGFDLQPGPALHLIESAEREIQLKEALEKIVRIENIIHKWAMEWRFADSSKVDCPKIDANSIFDLLNILSKFSAPIPTISDEEIEAQAKLHAERWDIFTTGTGNAQAFESGFRRALELLRGKT